MPDCSLAWAQPNMVIAVDIWVYISIDPLMSQLSISVSILNLLELLCRKSQLLTVTEKGYLEYDLMVPYAYVTLHVTGNHNLIYGHYSWTPSLVSDTANVLWTYSVRLLL